MEQSIKLKNIGIQLKKQWYLLMLIPLFFGGMVLLSNMFLFQKVYMSTTQLIILPNNSDEKVSSEQNIRMNMQLMNTFVTLVKSPRTMNQVSEELKLEKEELKLLKEMEISSDQNSLIVTLKIKSTTATKAKETASLIAHITEKNMNSYFPHSKVEIFEPAQVGAELSNIKRYIVSGIIGIWTALIIIFISGLRSSQITSEEDLRKYGFPIIGIIPNGESKELFK